MALFVTAYGRLRLHRMMVSLEDDLIYVDTGEMKYSMPPTIFENCSFSDSVFYYHRPTRAMANVGPYLGQFKDTLNGRFIRMFIACGPKMYAYVTDDNKEEYRAKGEYYEIIIFFIKPINYIFFG